MFLKELYNFNKLLFYILIGYFFAFIFINAKQSVYATPIYEYGMYSAKVYLNDTQSVFKIYVNNKLLDFSESSFEDRDWIFGLLHDYKNQKNTNEVIYNVLETNTRKIGLNNLFKRNYYTNSGNDTIFSNWYKNLLQKFTKIKISTIEIFEQKIVWQLNKVKEIDSPKKLQFIVSN